MSLPLINLVLAVLLYQSSKLVFIITVQLRLMYYKILMTSHLNQCNKDINARINIHAMNLKGIQV